MYLKFIPLLAVTAIWPLFQHIATGEKPTAVSPVKSKNNRRLEQHQQGMIDVNQLKQTDWYSTIVKNIEQSEYNFSKVDNKEAYSTPNRKNNLRFYYDETGFSVEPCTTKIPIGENDKIERPDEIKYKTLPGWKVQFNLDSKQVGKGTWQVEGNKAEYKTDNITVQYINGEEGMRENFIVQKPLPGNQDLKLNFHVKTKLEQRFSSERLQFVQHKSGAVLNYDGLKVWDANGNILAAAFEKQGNDEYAICVHTNNAVYPITIDPVSSQPAWKVESNIRNGRMGSSLSGVGDINGDGYGDVAVGVPGYISSQSGQGAFYIYLGSPSGLSGTPATIVENKMRNGSIGSAVSGAGDINSDGYADVIAGVNNYSNGESNEGAIFVYYGSSTGINSSAADIIESNWQDANMGWSVSRAGDVNGDGYSDIIAGAPLFSNGQSTEGAAFIYLGSAAGIQGSTKAIVESNWVNPPGFGLIGMGNAVSAAGDVNSDGFGDIIVGFNSYNTNKGAFFIYHGSAVGIDTSAVLKVEGNSRFNIQLGNAVSGGDINGDGYSDIIAGAGSQSAVYIFYGSMAGIDITTQTIIEQPGIRLGVAVSCAGDINGDGYSDVIAGARDYNVPSIGNTGSLFIWYGSATGISATAVPAIIPGDNNGSEMGGTVSFAGDVNGDGYSDILAGARLYNNGQTAEGSAYACYGSADYISDVVSASIEGNLQNAKIASSVSTAGDVNGDGYDDLIVGAPEYDNGVLDSAGAFFIYQGSATGLGTVAATTVLGSQAKWQMGCSVSRAGDVNGDGYSDVVVGVLGYASGANTNEGAAFVYYGSAGGINIAAPAILESNASNTYMGNAVAGAGDVNGDGYNDVIVGAYRYNSECGAFYIYHGSAAGMLTSASTFATGFPGTRGQLGFSVSGAGDVNGDGYSDVVVGAPLTVPFYSGQGMALVYNGSPNGIDPASSTTLTFRVRDQYFGRSVSGAGDVNGDGYSDVIIGANGYNVSGQFQWAEGMAFIFYGSGNGVNSSSFGRVRELDQEQAFLGNAVSCAGDINNDGYSDVIVGAPLYDNGQNDEGAAFIYLGSAAGFNNTPPSVVIEGNQAGAQMGSSVSAADFNGDGFSDVLVGAPEYDNGQIDEGAVFAYNNIAGNSMNSGLKLYNTDLTTPIDRSNISAPIFGAGLFVKSFIGGRRGRGKLVWETRLSHIAYSGNPISTSILYTSEQSNYSDLGLAGAEFKNLVDKQQGGTYTKVRARIKYDTATAALFGQLYGPWQFGSELIAYIPPSALPVDLISFKAFWQQEGRTAKIEFTVDNESSISHYEIEKSSDGFNYTKIASIAAINTSALHTYSYIDEHATGEKQYYRLKTIHSGGDFDYSNIQLLLHKAVMEILVFPNPATDVLQLRLNHAYGKMNVRIVNISGQVVKQSSNLSTANQTIRIPVSSLASGTYFLQLDAGGEKQVLQFVKQ